MFVEEEERAVIITLDALDYNFSPLCVNLCIHQVFSQAAFEKNHTLPASICLRTQQPKTEQGTRYLFTSQCPSQLPVVRGGAAMYKLPNIQNTDLIRDL